MHRENWDDLRYVLAVAEIGSVSKAAIVLGVNHATVLRRIATFENRHGAPLFERTARGYRVLADKRDVIQAAREAETAIIAVQRLVEGHHPLLRGAIRVTSTDTLCHTILPAIAARLQAESKDLSIELISTNAHLDLSRLRADVTVRPAAGLSDDLVGTQAAMLGFAVYAAQPGSRKWLGLTGALSRSVVARWMAENIDPDDLSASADSFLTLRELATEGEGHAILPCLVGDADPRLQRCDGLMPDIAVPIWVASHADLPDTTQIRTLRSRLVEAIGERSDQLAGV